MGLKFGAEMTLPFKSKDSVGSLIDKNPFKLTSERRQNELEYSSALALSSKTLLDEKFSSIACVTRRESRKHASERRQNQLEYSQPFTLARHHRHTEKVAKKVSKFEFW